jgi:hypothetical protein
MDTVKVIITQSRQGPKIGYKSGQVVVFPKAKALMAIAAGWAVYADPQDDPKPLKPMPPIAGKMAPAQGWEAVMAMCGGDFQALRSMAREHKVKGWALVKDPQALAEKIAEKIA